MQFSGVSRFLPSKRIGALVVVVAALIASTLIIRADTTAKQGGPVARLTGRPTNLIEIDTDGDGVKDWEEELRGLSTVSDDTDGDGVKDGQEVEEERIRMEEQRSTFLAEASDLAVSYDGLSETEKLSRGVLEQVIAFESAGITLDGETTNDIASILGSTLQQPPTPVRVASIDSITLVEETSGSLSAYANALGTILGGEATVETNELLVLARFGETGNVAALESLNDVAATYGKIITDLTNTPVPSTLADKHVALINNFANTKQNITLLAELGKDPLKGLQGLQTYFSYSEAVARTFNDISSYLRSRVTLASHEPGYLIIQATAQ